MGGKEQFFADFKVTPFIAPTEEFHRARVLDKEVAEKADALGLYRLDILKVKMLRSSVALGRAVADDTKYQESGKNGLASSSKSHTIILLSPINGPRNWVHFRVWRG